MKTQTMRREPQIIVTMNENCEPRQYWVHKDEMFPLTKDEARQMPRSDFFDGTNLFLGFNSYFLSEINDMEEVA